jgi:alpha-ketoglutarate-dependent 2,4-dichlorophenoxyacetate dioxygenase
VRQPLVRLHPITGRKSLFLSSHAGSIVGWPMPEARSLLRELTEHAVQPAFVHVHEWRQNDLVMWDNRQVMHRVRRFRQTKEVRDMRRTTIQGDGGDISTDRRSLFAQRYRKPAKTSTPAVVPTTLMAASWS